MSLIKAKGVDICVHNGDVNFEILKAYGVQFVMIGLGDRFHENVRKAEAAGMPWGASNCKTFTVTVSADQTGKYTLTAADIAVHRADSSFIVAFVANFAYNNGLSYRGGLNTNHRLSDGSTYGFYMRTNSSGSNSHGFITKASTASGAEIGTNDNGEIFVYATSTLVLRAGTYTVFCGW